MKYLFFCLSLFLISCIVIPGNARAQFNTPLPTSVNVDLVPENPGPNDTVHVTLSSYDTDLNAANMIWSVNGKTQQSGKGQKTFTFVMGGVDTATQLSITIQTADGEIIKKSYPLKPTSVDLIWQADGFVPPFFKGKTLFSYQDRIKFIALPHISNGKGSEIAASNLIYTWTENGTVLGDYSGYGKNTLTISSSLVSRPLDIQVNVTSPTTSDTGSAETIATPFDPQVVLYEKNPLYGIQFQKALENTITLTNSKEIEVIGEPYFFGTPGSFVYNWNINNVPIGGDTSKTSQVFRQKDGVVGSSYISLSIENPLKMLQSASQGFSITFGKSQTTQSSF